jgi:MSHA pilin protein MshD
MCIRPALAQGHQRGSSLIELIVFIVIVSVALAGVLSVLNITVLHSADAIEPKQALAVAESMMEEVLTKPFCDPDTVTVSNTPPTSTCGAHTAEGTVATRNLYDDVLDYNGYHRVGVSSLTDPGTSIGGLGSYTVDVAVAAPAADIGAVAAANIWQITVTVTAPSGRAYTLTGYRFNY